jgi:hypothetical protein
MTLDKLLTEAASECIDERERYLVMFTQGANGYVCRNEGLTDENQALFKGSYRDCQIWIERRGIAAALRYISEHSKEVPKLTGNGNSVDGLLTRLLHTPQ